MFSILVSCTIFGCSDTDNGAFKGDEVYITADVEGRLDVLGHMNVLSKAYSVACKHPNLKTLRLHITIRGSNETDGTYTISALKVRQYPSEDSFIADWSWASGGIRTETQGSALIQPTADVR